MLSMFSLFFRTKIQFSKTINKKTLRTYLVHVFKKYFMFSKTRRIKKTERTCLVFKFFFFFWFRKNIKNSRTLNSDNKNNFQIIQRMCFLYFQKTFSRTVFKNVKQILNFHFLF